MGSEKESRESQSEVENYIRNPKQEGKRHSDQSRSTSKAIIKGAHKADQGVQGLGTEQEEDKRRTRGPIVRTKSPIVRTRRPRHKRRSLRPRIRKSKTRRHWKHPTKFKKRLENQKVSKGIFLLT